MSNLTDLLPAGAGGKQVSFTADGAISSGKTVALQTDGTVKEISATATPETVGTATPLSSPSSLDTVYTSAYDSANNAIVVPFRDPSDSYKGKAVVFTQSGTTTSIGTPVTFTSSTIYLAFGIVYDSNAEKVAIMYSDITNSSYVYCVVGTVSGSSISFGTPVVAYSGGVSWGDQTGDDNVGAVFDSANNKVVFTFRDPSNYPRSIVGTISGTSISFGTSNVANGQNSGMIASAYDVSAGKIIIAVDNNITGQGELFAATVSGTSITHASQTVFNGPSTVADIGLTYVPDENLSVLVYRDVGGGSVGEAKTISYDGSSFTQGTTVTYGGSGAKEWNRVAYDSSAGKLVVAFRDAGDSDYGNYVVGTISGTDITFATKSRFEAASTNKITLSYNSTEQVTFIGYNDVANSQRLTGIALQNAASNVANFVGISDAAISDTASGSVTIKGGIVANIPIGYYSLSSPSYDEKSFTPSPAINSIGVAFKTDGTKMYTLDLNGDDVAQYSLTSAWDVSTATSDSKTFDVGSQDTDPYEISFKSDGTKMYILGTANDTLYQYSLSSAWDVSTASYDSVSFSFTSQTLQPYGMDFSPDGTKLYIGDYQNVRVLQYELSTAWDVSTMSYASKLLDASTQVGGQFIYSVAVSSDGTSIFVGTHSSGNIYQYSLSSAFDVSSGSYAGVSFSTSAQEGSVTSIAFKSDGAKMYVTGFTSDAIFQYSTTTALTPNQNYYVQADGSLSTTVSSVLAGKALSSTSINLDYTT